MKVNFFILSYILGSSKLSFKNLFKIQRYLYKSILVYDFSKALSFQKLIWNSNSVRLIAIRDITQLDHRKSIPGIDGLICSSFLERFKLNEYLKLNAGNWYPNMVKKVKILKKDGVSESFEIPTIADRCWQRLVQFSLEPAHDAIFSLRSFGFRSFISFDKIYKTFSYNLNKDSYGIQKRIFIVNLESKFEILNLQILMKKMILPRSIKLGIFRSLNLGLKLRYPSFYSNSYDLPAVLLNIVLDGIESIHSSIRFGYYMVFFLKPSDNEIALLGSVKSFLNSVGVNDNRLEYQIVSSLHGFNFLYWNFKVLNNGNFLCNPSFQTYQQFLLRVKHIINNSNYGAVCIFNV